MALRMEANALKQRLENRFHKKKKRVTPALAWSTFGSIDPNVWHTLQEMLTSPEPNASSQSQPTTMKHAQKKKKPPKTAETHRKSFLQFVPVWEHPAKPYHALDFQDPSSLTDHFHWRVQELLTMNDIDHVWERKKEMQEARQFLANTKKFKKGPLPM